MVNTATILAAKFNTSWIDYFYPIEKFPSVIFWTQLCSNLYCSNSTIARTNCRRENVYKIIGELTLYLHKFFLDILRYIDKRMYLHLLCKLRCFYMEMTRKDLKNGNWFSEFKLNLDTRPFFNSPTFIFANSVIFTHHRSTVTFA